MTLNALQLYSEEPYANELNKNQKIDSTLHGTVK